MDWVVGLKTSQFHHLSIREHAYLNLDVLKMIKHICQSLNTSRKKLLSTCIMYLPIFMDIIPKARMQK